MKRKGGGWLVWGRGVPFFVYWGGVEAERSAFRNKPQKIEFCPNLTTPHNPPYPLPHLFPPKLQSFIIKYLTTLKVFYTFDLSITIKLKTVKKELISKLVNWWAELTTTSALNSNNGDNSYAGGLAFLLMNMLAQSKRVTISEDQVSKFKEKLTELIEAELENFDYLSLGVDYHPDNELSEAASYAGISDLCFPVETNSVINLKTNTVKVSLGYGGKWIEL